MSAFVLLDGIRTCRDEGAQSSSRHLNSPQVFLDPLALLARIVAVRLTALFLTPSLLETCMRAGASRRIRTGGAADDADAFATAFEGVRVLWLTGERVRPELVAEVRSRSFA